MSNGDKNDSSEESSEPKTTRPITSSILRTFSKQEKKINDSKKTKED